MKNKESPYTRRVYPMRMILDIAGLSSAAWYRKNSKGSDPQRRKPGLNPIWSDERIVDEIRSEIKNSKFHSEGYKKIYKRIKNRGIRCGRNRVYRLMVEHNLLAPQRPVKTGSSREHDGTITTTLPNKMWGTDGKYFWTQKEGQCWLFSVIDHCNDEILGWHTAKVGNRFAAMEPVKQAIQKSYGKIDRNICVDTGLFLRSDHGSQYDSNDFQNELKFLGLVHSPAFVRSPECNGVIERFHRTIQEQIFDLYVFENLAQAQEVIGTFMKEYNESWLIHRLGLMSPLQFRQEFEKQKALNCA